MSKDTNKTLRTKAFNGWEYREDRKIRRKGHMGGMWMPVNTRETHGYVWKVIAEYEGWLEQPETTRILPRDKADELMLHLEAKAWPVIEKLYGLKVASGVFNVLYDSWQGFRVTNK